MEGTSIKYRDRYEHWARLCGVLADAFVENEKDCRTTHTDIEDLFVNEDEIYMLTADDVCKRMAERIDALCGTLTTETRDGYERINAILLTKDGAGFLPISYAIRELTQRGVPSDQWTPEMMAETVIRRRAELVMKERKGVVADILADAFASLEWEQPRATA